MLPINTSSPPSLASQLAQRAKKAAPADAADAQRIKKKEDEKRQYQEAADALTRGVKEMRASRKNAAREKVARLKEELRMMRMMGVDAKSLARLARELGAAAKEYGEGKAPISDGLAQAQTQALTNEAPTTPVPADEAKTKEALASQVKDAALTQFAQNEEKAQEGKADAEFVNEAKRLMQEIKSLLASKKNKAKMQSDAEAKDIDDADKAVSAAERELSELSRALTPTLSLLI
jgi:hypothetical protein